MAQWGSRLWLLRNPIKAEKHLKYPNLLNLHSFHNPHLIMYVLDEDF